MRHIQMWYVFRNVLILLNISFETKRIIYIRQVDFHLSEKIFAHKGYWSDQRREEECRLQDEQQMFFSALVTPRKSQSGEKIFLQRVLLEFQTCYLAFVKWYLKYVYIGNIVAQHCKTPQSTAQHAFSVKPLDYSHVMSQLWTRDVIPMTTVR